MTGNELENKLHRWENEAQVERRGGETWVWVQIR